MSFLFLSFSVFQHECARVFFMLHASEKNDIGCYNRHKSEQFIILLSFDDKNQFCFQHNLSLNFSFDAYFSTFNR